ncbi:MAG: hypothetical protein PHI32_07595 [Dysgonamonadaceae bacterium]|nr:hypothetical protein [Dysgonamonadaceae bacterium]MDD4728466.1 hypothetical protein [Dysgonamonadaceae bacterium]
MENKIKDFLEKWIKFEIYETDVESIYQIYSGISKNGVKVDLSTHGFNLYFGSKDMIKNYQQYGFNSLDSFKKAAVISLYQISRISAEEIVKEHIKKANKNGNPVKETNYKKYIWEGKSVDCPEKWSIYMDLRELE